jgi:hypothetical protein
VWGELDDEHIVWGENTDEIVTADPLAPEEGTEQVYIDYSQDGI